MISIVSTYERIIKPRYQQHADYFVKQKNARVSVTQTRATVKSLYLTCAVDSRVINRASSVT